tara:strand:+ start:21074 stop:24160 length:3087 start_codon:yes stop_codon:yes gene_type:complete
LNSNYEIYNASAGSGKTFTLTARYLSKFLGDSQKESYRKILALTFTNKASEEMKNRVLLSLKEFSDSKAVENPSEMLKAVKDQLDISINEIHIRAKKRLTLLLHNYSFFNVSTLDSFSHNIIRSFSKELKITSDFQLILDSEQFIDESIERLLSLVGIKKEITQALVEFANSKISEGKSWDVTYDLKNLSSLLNNENYHNKIKSLEKKNMKDFRYAKETIFKTIKELEAQIENQVQLLEKAIKLTKIEVVFSRNSFPIFLKKLKRKDFNKINLESIRNLFIKNTIITKKSSEGNEEKVLALKEKLFGVFEKIEKKIDERSLLKSFQQSIVPVSVLNQVKKNLDKIQNEKGELLISEFNKIISEEIKDQPVPYIFEKTGNRYKHYLIDEFQDTSMLQWANLVPLISHSIESGENEKEMGSLTIVGDPKQSLYRWRGANPDKFISLFNNENPFMVTNTNKILPKNYRSCDEIVLFNNLFFEHISKTFHFKQNQEIYRDGCSQELNDKKEGFVSVELLEKHNEKQLNEQAFLSKTLNIIKDCKKRGFSYSDQSVLVRNKNQQSIISEFLIKNKIPVISAESLMLKNSSNVRFLIELIRLRNEPNNLSSRKAIIKYFIEKEKKEDPFDFYKKLLNQKIDKFFDILIGFSYQDFIKVPVYDGIMTIQSKLSLDLSEDAHLQFFMDEIFDFFLKENRNELQFLEFWEINKEKLNIAMAGDDNAVQILTIHKSKGLEFPVVIYPFADSSSHRPNSQRVWLPFGCQETKLDLLVPFNKTVKSAGEKGKNIYNKIRREEELDNANILYVALTRAINEMYIVATLSKKASLLSHNEALRSFLESSGRWEQGKLAYSWGKKNKNYFSDNAKKQSKKKLEKSFPFLVFKPNFDDFYKDDQIVFGNLFHKLMSKIKYSFQFEKEARLFLEMENNKKLVLKEIIILVKRTIEKTALSSYFTKEFEVICEKEIFTKNKEVMVPDRIVVSPSNKHTIIEYKTGEKREEHMLQIKKYANTLSDMGLNVENSILVYVGHSIEVIEL